MSLFTTDDLQEFSKLYTKVYGVVLTLDETESRLTSLTELLATARESRLTRNGTSNPVTYNTNNPQNHA
jgi:hypothetical protein